jgi:citrate synthase
MSVGSWISAAEAARLLDVSRTTLYAYVSRGYVRSQATPGPSRDRQYSRDDVERLRRRTEERRDPGKAAARALQWGVPVLESSIALIDGASLYYRGHDAIELARSRSVAEVASLIWSGGFDTVLPADPLAVLAPAALAGPRLPFVPRAQVMLAAAAAADPQAFDTRPQSIARTGWRILHLLTRAAAGRAAGRPGLPGHRSGVPRSIDAALARAWRVPASGIDVLRSALILCADHELNVSSFTARCVASAGSHPYAVVIAGLAALEGTRHGGSGARVESMLDSVRRARSLEAALADRLRRGERIEGLGHPLYRHGDPRAAALLDLLSDRYGKSPELRFVLAAADAGAALMRERPNIDFALVGTARVLRLPPGAALTLFAIGRTIGWIGHAIEQYATGQLIRPRAKYAGIAPPSLSNQRDEPRRRGRAEARS